MLSPTTRSSRRSLIAAATSTGLLAVHSIHPARAQSASPSLTSLSILPDVPDGATVRVLQLTLHPSEAWAGSFGGRTSLMVLSGVLTAPLTAEKTMIQIYSSPGLTPMDGTPASFTQAAIQPPELLVYQGVIADDGNFGELQNNGSENLVLVFVATSRR